MKKLFAILLSSLTLSTVSASETINVLSWGRPGGNTEGVNRAIAKEIEKAGYKINFEFVEGCRGIQKWIEKNPGKPAVFDLAVHQDLTRIKYPSSGQACDVGLKKEDVLSISAKNSLNFCSMQKDEIVAWRTFSSGNEVKIGYNRLDAVFGDMVEGTAKAVNAKSKFVEIKGSPALTQALISGDVDMVITGNPANVIKAGATCFLQTDLTKRKTTRFKYNEVLSNSPWQNAGHMNVWVGKNLPGDFRQFAIDAANNSEHVARSVKLGAERSGVAVGQSVEQQWTEINNYLKMFKD